MKLIFPCPPPTSSPSYSSPDWWLSGSHSGCLMCILLCPPPPPNHFILLSSPPPLSLASFFLTFDLLTTLIYRLFSSFICPPALSSRLTLFPHLSDPLVFPVLLYSFPPIYCWCCSHHNCLAADNYCSCACFTWQSDNFSHFFSPLRREAGWKNRLKYFSSQTI